MVSDPGPVKMRKPTAMPTDVRKVCDLPKNLRMIWAAPINRPGRSPKNRERARKVRDLPHIRWQSHGRLSNSTHRCALQLINHTLGSLAFMLRVVDRLARLRRHVILVVFC